MNKKIYTGLFTLIITLLFLALPNTDSINANALVDATSGFSYEIVNNNIMITGYTGNDADIKIPAKIANKQVVSIDDGAFSDNQSIMCVSIPKTVNSIGDLAMGYYYNPEDDIYVKNDNFKIKCYTASIAVQYALNNGFNYEIVDTKPAVVRGFRAVSSTVNSISLAWNQVATTEGYIIYNYNVANDKWVRVAKTITPLNTYNLTNLNSGTTFKFAIKAYRTVDGTEIASNAYPVIIAATKPADVTGFKAAAESVNAIKLSWNRVSGANGYIVYQVKNGKWARIAKTNTNVTSYVVKKLTRGYCYRFAIKAYKTVTNHELISTNYPTVYGYTKIPTITGFKVAGVSDSAVKLTWNKLNDAHGYIVYQMKSNKWVRVAKTATNSNVYFIKNLESETQYKFAVKAYRSICGKEIVSINFPTTTAKTKKETVKIKVINGITYVNGVLIANKTYKLPSTYNPGGLTRETKAAFQKMQQGAAKDNVSLWITSGYRSYSYQASLYNSYVSSNGQAAADRFAARPGYSEHQTGLAIDVNYASSWFNNTTCAKWIENHCAEYGFILRYPRGKESKTGYMYESWHVRYVGVDLAKKVMASGLCLEEYFGITSKYK